MSDVWETMGLASSPLFREGKLKDKEKVRDLLKVIQ